MQAYRADCDGYIKWRFPCHPGRRAVDPAREDGLAHDPGNLREPGHAAFLEGPTDTVSNLKQLPSQIRNQGPKPSVHLVHGSVGLRSVERKVGADEALSTGRRRLPMWRRGISTPTLPDAMQRRGGVGAAVKASASLALRSATKVKLVPFPQALGPCEWQHPTHGWDAPTAHAGQCAPGITTTKSFGFRLVPRPLTSRWYGAGIAYAKFLVPGRHRPRRANLFG